ncbi:MAG: hypothetical protein V3R77_06715 [Candidatus Binatia bacterium]
MENPQISGKVFRFLSAMHPALSKGERKKYAAYDPDQWYDWTPEVSTEFTDLMRRSPRDTSFARGLAYVAQRAVPEGQYIPTADLLEHITCLPAAYRGPEGTGFHAELDKPGHATVSYGGMPGFANVCIAIQGELTQRLQASGAQSVVVKHAETCRVSGGEECRFDIEWSGEVPPSGAEATATKTLLDEELAASVSGNAPAAEPEPPIVATPQANEEPPRSSVIARLRADGPSAPQVAASAGGGAVAAAALAEQPGVSAAPEVAENVPVEVAPAPKPRPKSKRAAQDEAPAADEGQLAAEMLASVGEDVDGSNDDLFVQLRKRLADADRQARMYAEAQSQIEALRVELSRMRAQAEAEIAAAAKERDDATEAFAELKRRIQSAISDD